MYAVVLNRPGYLPESDPIICVDLEEAYTALEDEVSNALDSGLEFLPHEGMDALTLFEIENGFIYGAFSDGYILDVQPISIADDHEDIYE